MDSLAKHSIREPNSGCHLWQGYLDEKGYARVWHRGRAISAHRVAYIAEHGTIPAGLEIDHLCRTRCCVNPDHLEAVTHAENIRRGDYSRNGRNRAWYVPKTHCPQGHPYAGENLFVNNRGARVCRTCTRKADRERKRTLRRAAR